MNFRNLTRFVGLDNSTSEVELSNFKALDYSLITMKPDLSYRESPPTVMVYIKPEYKCVIPLRTHSFIISRVECPSTDLGLLFG